MTVAPVQTFDVESAAPPAPATLAATGLPFDQVEQLVIKTLYAGGATGLALQEEICLPFDVLEPVIERDRAERLIEVRGASSASAATYYYVLTDLGRDRARQYLEVNQYTGPAPVPLAQYAAAVSAAAARRAWLPRERLYHGFDGLVVGESMIERLGPAVNANKAIFLYGAPGNGKTVLAKGMARAAGGDMFIPHAVEVDGQIITLFDPITHHRIVAPRTEPTILLEDPVDRRWVRIERPVVVVGGELTLDMLDLRFNPLSRFYEAPTQLKANGGVFLVDDFGRQRARPAELLNRWIVPLENRIDFLTLHTGKKFQVPFDVLIVFATNLDPATLADEAFMRRIPYKIRVDDPSLDEFSRILEMDCQRRHLPFEPAMVQYLFRRHYAPTGRPLRACHPRDLLDQVTALCKFRGTAPVLTPELLDVACRSYFVSGASTGAPTAATAISASPGMEVH